MKLIRKHFYLTKEQVKRIEADAKKLKCSESEVIRRLIDKVK